MSQGQKLINVIYTGLKKLYTRYQKDLFILMEIQK